MLDLTESTFNFVSFNDEHVLLNKPCFDINRSSTESTYQQVALFRSGDDVDMCEIQLTDDAKIPLEKHHFNVV